MKMRTIVWTLAWDDKHETDCRVFGSEAECFTYFRGVIEKDIADLQISDAVEIRGLLEHDDIGAAYDLWQATYKDELSTYNWGPQEVEVEIDAASQLSMS